MFKQRLLTALVLVLLFLVTVYAAPPKLLFGLVVLITGYLGYEWLQLIPLKSWLWRVMFLLGLLVLIAPAMVVSDDWVWGDLLAWLGIFIAVVHYPSSEAVWGKPWIVGGIAYLLLPMLASALSALYAMPNGMALIVYLFCLIWAADIGAYLIGKQWGRTKLIPLVSPGKTIEGVLGGVCSAMLVSALSAGYFKPTHLWYWFGLALGTAVLSVLGDLFISMLKRRVNLKDTGCIFPGHGGVLDRLDSLIAALPFFYGVVRCVVFV